MCEKRSPKRCQVAAREDIGPGEPAGEPGEEVGEPDRLELVVEVEWGA